MLELRGVHLALKTCYPSIQSKSILVQTDNTTTMYYLNKQGETRSRPLSLEAQAIWHMFLARQLSITVVHLPGEQNSQADSLNRHFEDQQDWVLNDEVVADIFLRWGHPSVDLFADESNKKCHAFASRFYRPGSIGNALLIDWSGTFVYAFPPPPLIPKVITKLTRSRMRMILIAPDWPRQWWYPDLLHL